MTKAKRTTGAMMRTRSREAALQFLYLIEFSPNTSLSMVDFLDRLFPEAVLEGEEDPTVLPELSENARQFAIEIVNGVSANRDEIDDIISTNAEKWSISRMSSVDRNVLRISTYEMKYRNDIPKRVAINEAINLAKKFGGEKSGAFVNSILDKIRASLEHVAE